MVSGVPLEYVAIHCNVVTYV